MVKLNLFFCKMRGPIGSSLATETGGLFNEKKSGLIRGKKLNMTSAGKDSRRLIYKSLYNWAKTCLHRVREEGSCSSEVNE